MRVFKSLVFVLRIGRGLIATLSQVLSSVILRGGSLGQPAKPMTLLTWVIPQRTVHPLPHEVIDRGQKGGEHLAGSGRRRDQQMAAALDRRPSLRLFALDGGDPQGLALAVGLGLVAGR